MKRSVWDNRPMRRLAVTALALLLFLFACGWLVSAALVRDNVDVLVARDAKVAGLLIEKYPEDTDAITQILAGVSDVAEETERTGSEALAKWGYQTGMPWSLNAAISTIPRGVRWFITLWGAVMVLALFGCGLWSFRRIYRDMRALTLQASEAVRVGAPVSAMAGEGDFAALQNAVHAMSQRLQHTIAELAADKAYLKDFLSDVSHQFKTPIAAMSIQNDLLLAQPDMPLAQRQQFVQRNIAQLEHMQFLVSGLLKQARLESGTVVMRMEMQPLLDTVRTALQANEPLAERRGVACHTDIPADLSLCHDAAWLAEAVGNLIKNAVEHTGAGGHVYISAKSTPMTVQLCVRDTGSGIAREDLPHVFERFYRARGSDKDSVGIGLALAQSIVERLGGDISVESAYGAGATFTITFLTQM
nr:HAMP domain-containing sensor histidine kinase [Maliibacterium massiliense]